jgi:cellulose synthase/poly-beta-1,6-N-acetylglucosamine synthase-like glycosyltransferase
LRRFSHLISNLAANVLTILLGGTAIFFLALIYPFVFYPLILRLYRKLPFGEATETPAPATVAMLFCAYNEAQSLPAKIENIRALKKAYPDLEVRAYSDCCSDDTADLLRAASDVLILHESLERTGKAAGMAKMVAATEAEILVFTDANVILDPAAISKILAYFADETVGTVAGTLHYTNFDDGQTAMTGMLYWRVEEWIKRLESETGSTMGADGSIFATRRSLYPDVPVDLLDDLTASISPIFQGYRVVVATDVHAFEKSTTSSADEFRRKRRIACRAFNTHRHLAPQLRRMSFANRFKYFSHKYLRWFSGAFLILTAAFATGSVVILFGAKAAAVLVAGGLIVLGLGHKLQIPVIGTIAELSVSMIAVATGIADALAGRNYTTWNPPKSRE